MYINFQTFKKTLLVGSLVSFVALTSCKKDDNTPVPPPSAEGANFFIDAGGDQNKTRYLLVAKNVENGELPLSANQEQFKEANGYFWQFNKNTAVGLSYGFRGAGIGISYEKTAQGVKHLTDFDVAERATTFGFFSDYWITVVGGQEYEGKKDGATFNFRNANNYTKAFSKTIHTANLLPEMNTSSSTQEIVSFAGILDNGNGEFFSGMIVSDYKDVQVAQGSSTGKIHNPDVVYVGVLDKDLNLKRSYKSDKLSYSAGRFKSQYLLEMGKADNGDVYVFSGAIAKNPPKVKAPQTPDVASTKPAGALRIKQGATDFDSSYFFDISAVSGNGIFRRVWHITGNKFLLEFFNDASKAALNVVDVNRFAIVDMEAKSFNWVTGLPALSDFANMTSNPVELAVYNGKVYLPVNVKNSDPAIYVIDPATNVATKGLTVKGASFINAIGRFK